MVKIHKRKSFGMKVGKQVIQTENCISKILVRNKIKRINKL